LTWKWEISKIILHGLLRLESRFQCTLRISGNKITPTAVFYIKRWGKTSVFF
jgi:hypothetical protein